MEEFDRGGFDRWPVRYVINARTPEQVVAELTRNRYGKGKDVRDYVRAAGISGGGYHSCILGALCSGGGGEHCERESHRFTRGSVEDVSPIVFECETCGTTKAIPGKLKLSKRELRSAAKHRCQIKPGFGDACGKRAIA